MMKKEKSEVTGGKKAVVLVKEVEIPPCWRTINGGGDCIVLCHVIAQWGHGHRRFGERERYVEKRRDLKVCCSLPSCREKPEAVLALLTLNGRGGRAAVLLNQGLSHSDIWMHL
jgi:hypothetical protein